MTRLAALRDGRTGPGAYTWHDTHDLDDIRHAVEVSGGHLGHVVGPVEPTRRAMHEALAAALDFPRWYGHNLDALADCLRDVPGSTVVLWDGWADLARDEPRAFGVAVQLLGERLVLLLRGPGPDLDLPALG